MVDVSRRFFCFGAAATLILPKPKSFFIIEPPKLVVAQLAPGELLGFDLPAQQALSLMQKLQDQVIEVSAIPRWVVINQKQYDLLVEAERRQHGRHLQA